MPQSYQAGEFNSFVGGLVTEASPLAFPENGSLDELNMVINNDNTRRRRLGMDYLPNTSPFNTNSFNTNLSDETISTFNWKNPGDVSGKEFTVVQLGNVVWVLDKSDESLASIGYRKYSLTLTNSAKCSFASLNGTLVIAQNSPNLIFVKYADSFIGSFSVTKNNRLKIRDLFGVAANPDGVLTWEADGVSYRPKAYTNPSIPTVPTLVQRHVYNLRNQGWMEPRARWFEQLGAKTPNPAGFVPEETMGDPIEDFMFPTDAGGRISTNTLPSNADNITQNLYPCTEPYIADGYKDIERFDAVNSASTRPGSQSAPKGYFIIDLFDRGGSREDAYAEAQDKLKYVYGRDSSTTLDFFAPSLSLPADSDSGGISVVADYAGRAWYSGISSTFTSFGDALSPSLGSFVLYSQQGKDTTSLTRCYQEGDPTSKDAPDRLDTDGGFIRIAECSNVKEMVNIGNSLLVIAENGVWAISGSDSGEFSANNQSVTKVTEHGTTLPQSVAVVDGSVIYWSDEAIYQIAVNELGEWAVQELTQNIRKFYQSIPAVDKLFVRGLYDSFDRKVRWVYGNSINTVGGSKELVFDLKSAAFTPLEIKALSANTPTILSPVKTAPFKVVEEQYNIIAGTDNILVDTDQAVVTIEGFADETREISYLAYDPLTGNVKFATYNNQEFLDWKSVDNIGADAAAYLLTGYIGTGDNARYKQVPYIYFHFLRTETGFVDDGNDLQVVGESSCLVQSQWDWSNSVASGKWGREFQAYRYKRAYMPSSEADGFDTGTATIVSKNKLRGRGRVLSLKISTEPGKDLQLLGWSMAIGTNNNF